jgi:hypothetical protein
MRRRLLLVLLVYLFTSPIWAWEFNTDDDTEGWKGIRSQVSAKDGVLTATVVGDTSGNDPWIEPKFGPYDANDIGGFYMKVKWSVPDASRFGSTRLYWFPASGGHNSVAYAAPDDPNQFSVVYIDLLTREALENTNYWEGMINTFRIDLADGPAVGEDYAVDFDWIRLESRYIDNESFEYWDSDNDTAWGWHVPADEDNFDFDEQTTVRTRDYALKVIGKGAYQHITQDIKGGLALEKGARINLMGALNIPTASWHAGSVIWFRVRELTHDGQENLSAPIAVTTWDEWFEFNAELTLMHEPADRAAVDIQLFSSTPAGTAFYTDDIFVYVLEPTTPDEDKHWNWTKSSWEFNTPGDFEDWSGNFNAIQSAEVGEGVATLVIPAATGDPYITSPMGPFYTDKSSGLAARMRVSTGPASGGYENFWFFDEGGFSNTTYTVPVIEEWFVLYKDLSTDPGWDGWVNTIRYDLGDGYDEDVVVEIDWVRFVDEYVNNNGFEGSLEPWFHQGGGDLSTFSLSSDQVFSGATALKIEGIGGFHALTQRVEGWDQIPRGARVSVKGYYYVPSATWDPDGTIWFRVNEYDGSNPPAENYSPTLTTPVLDAWTAFEYDITTIYEPEARVHMSLQMFSNCAPGTIIYADDVFVSVDGTPPTVGWPINSVKLAADQVIVVDGTVTPEEYAGVQAVVINQETAIAADPYLPSFIHNMKGRTPVEWETTDLDDYNATYYFMWDDEYFYAAVSVQDDNYTFIGDTPNAADCLQWTMTETPGETRQNKMYIPTIAPQGSDGGDPVAKNDFGGYIEYDLFQHPEAEYAGSVDPDTQDWTVEVKIPWWTLVGDFDNEIFPPAVGDSVGFTVIAIDHDDQLQVLSVTHPGSFPWEMNGQETLTFVDTAGE